MSTAEPRDWISSFSSCAAPSLCTWQWKRDPRQSEAHVVPAIGKKRGRGGRNRIIHDFWKKCCFKFFPGNTILVLCLRASPHTKEQKQFCSMLPSNKKQSPAKHIPLWMATLHMLCKCCKAWLSLLTTSYGLTSLQYVPLCLIISISSTPLQNEAGEGGGWRAWGLIAASFSRICHQLHLVWQNVFHPNIPYNML